MIIAIILSSLALLAAATAAGLCLRERKRSQERNTALMQYISRSVEDMENRVARRLVDFDNNFTNRFVDLENKFSHRLADLENGLLPDYEKAKEAANAVNSFNDGITGILGFDPYAALQAQRDKERGGEHS